MVKTVFLFRLIECYPREFLKMIDVNVQKKLKNIHIDLSFNFDQNRVVIFGRSGSGKSTLLKIIAGFFNPSKGRIIINGVTFFDKEKNIHLPIHERNVGYLPQSYTLFPNLSVKNNILYGPKAHRLPYDSAKLNRITERLEIKSFLEKSPSRLSGGQQQRVALARVLMIQPRILLLDEPFGALDVELRESLRELVSEICDDYNIPALFVTHDLEEAFTFGDGLVMVDNGCAMESGDLARVYEKPQFVESASMLGFMNIWPISQWDQQELILESGQRLVLSEKIRVKPDYACIRNGQVMILRDDRPVNKSLKENVFQGNITLIRHRGNYCYLMFKDESGFTLHISIPNHAFEKLNIKKGRKVSVSLKKESIVLCNSHRL